MWYNASLFKQALSRPMKKALLTLTFLTALPCYAHGAESSSPPSAVPDKIRSAIEAAGVPTVAPPAPEAAQAPMTEGPEKDFFYADKNGDQKITPYEYVLVVKEGLVAMDKNKDGRLDLNEGRVFFGEPEEKPDDAAKADGTTLKAEEPASVQTEFKADRVMAEYDLDKNGEIIESEAMSKARDIFKTMDKNGDGGVVFEEYKSHEHIL